MCYKKGLSSGQGLPGENIKTWISHGYLVTLAVLDERREDYFDNLAPVVRPSVCPSVVCPPLPAKVVASLFSISILWRFSSVFFLLTARERD
jgi:hypothetical protein